jgi:hypothetical protein
VIALAGLRLVVEPEDGLGPRERDALASLRQDEPPQPGLGILRIELEPRGAATAAVAVPAEPARVAWDGERLHLEHAAFEAVIDAGARAAVVRRHGDDPTGLVTMLRTALSARLPLEGGVVLHAAALVHRGRAIVFFGPSGIGKSTLAGRSPWRVLGDELAAVLPRRGGDRRVVSGASSPAQKPVADISPRELDEPPLACLVELAQGPRFELERLERGTALRRLLGSLVVPPAPPWWSAALEVAGDLVRETPCYRMTWSLDASPFDPLDAALAAEPSG